MLMQSEKIFTSSVIEVHLRKEWNVPSVTVFPIFPMLIIVKNFDVALSLYNWSKFDFNDFSWRNTQFWTLFIFFIFHPKNHTFRRNLPYALCQINFITNITYISIIDVQNLCNIRVVFRNIILFIYYNAILP